jgi:hypothetical protein
MVGGTVMSKPSEVLIWINDDGSARELTEADKKYVDAEFSPFDGARPYIKSAYQSRNGWGEIKGYLERNKLPDSVPVDSAPPAGQAPPQKPQAVASQIRDLIRKHRG